MDAEKLKEAIRLFGMTEEESWRKFIELLPPVVVTAANTNSSIGGITTWEIIS